MIFLARSALVALGISAMIGSAGVPAAELACGDRLTKSAVLERDLDCPADGLVVGGDRVVIDCAGHTLRGATVPETAGIRVTGGTGIVVRDCHVVGFAAAIDATEAPGLLLTGNRLEDSRFYGVAVRDSAGTRLIRNVSRRQRFHASLTRSPGSMIDGNTFEPGAQPGAVNLSHSPESIAARNVFIGAGSIGVMDGGAAVVAHNVFRNGPSSIQVVRAQGCRVERNVFEATDDPRTSGGSIKLSDGLECEVRDNRIERVYGAGLFISGESDHSGRNRIAGNTVRGGGVGMWLEGMDEDVVESNLIEDVDIGIVVYAFVPPATGGIAATGVSRLARNLISKAAVGLYVVDSGTNIFERNELKDNGTAVLEIRVLAPRPIANSYEDNRIVRSSDYGFVAWGTSPVLRGNHFRENGTGRDLPSEYLDPLPTLLGHRRGGLALLPFVGLGNDTLDDGDSGNDFVGAPAIGERRSPNQFHNNGDFDVYALDERIANEESFLGDDRFQRGAVRFRQDWFGIVRVEDPSGAPVAGATVSVLDAKGRCVAAFSSGDDGVAPVGVDAVRSQGLSPLEPGGPRPPWPRFTQMVMDADGRRVETTPHRIVAQKGAASGCAVYAWNGRSDPWESGTSVEGRYETAVVRLGTPCFPPNPPPTSAPRFGENSTPVLDAVHHDGERR